MTSQSVRRSLQAMLSGFQIGEFRDKDETVKVMLREPSDTRNLLSALENVYVKTAVGASVPLRQVANAAILIVVHLFASSCRPNASNGGDSRGSSLIPA